MSSGFIFKLQSTLHSAACSPQWLVPINGGSVGRSPDCTWVIDDPDRVVSRQHARVDCDQSRCYWTDLGTNATLLNGKPLSQGQRVKLNVGDILRIGEHSMMLDNAQDAWSGIAGVMAPLEVDPLASLLPQNPPALNIDDLIAGLSLPSHGETPQEPANFSVLAQRMYVGLQGEPKPASSPAAASSESQQCREIARLKMLLTISVHGCMQLLQARRIFQEEMSGTVTTISSKANNPLKFSVTAEEALLRLLGNSSPAYLPAEQALEQAYQDILHHMQCSVEQSQGIMSQVRSALNPQGIQEELGLSGSFKLGLATTRKARLWDLFCERYAALGDWWN